ncbi:hypothetical protein BJX70DRAFT_394713 [Aspergillus crustosus]
MPSLTSTLGYTLTNFGPLPPTTPLSYAPSCTSNIILAETLHPDTPFWNPSCPSAQQICLPNIPNPAALESITQRLETPALGQLVAHYSPATACPGGWETVGVAGREGGTVVREGWFKTAATGGEDEAGTEAEDEDEYDGYDSGPAFASYVDILPILLDDSETAVQCCPSSMTLFPNGNCYSPLPASLYTPTLACRTYFTTDDIGPISTAVPDDTGSETSTEVLFITVTETGMVETVTIGAAGEEREGFIAYSQVPALMLLYKETDLVEGNVGGGDGGDGVENGGPGETNGAGALRLQVQVGGWGSGPGAEIWGVGVVLGSSVFVGAAMVLLR